MKLRVWLPALAAALLLAGYPQAQPSTATQPVQARRSTWKQFSSTQGGFSVLMPGTPKQLRLSQQTQIGPIDVYGFVVDQNQKSVGYVVMYADFPVNLAQTVNPKQIFNSGRDRVLNMVQGKLVSQRDVRLQRYPGKEFTYEAKGSIVKHRLYLVNRRMYQLIVVMDKNQQQSLSRSTTGFFNSFKLRSPQK
jgi:hypothetical protein